MNIFGILIIFILILFLWPLIFSSGFRKWITSNLQSLGFLLASFAPALFGVITGLFKAIFGVMKIYSIILLVTTLIALGLITISLFINSPALIVLAILLIIIAWLPAGLILRGLKLTAGVIPVTLKTFIAWTAFVGFLGLMCPDVLTLRSFFGASLVGLIFFGVCVKMNVLEKIVVPLVVVMCLWVGVGYFFPDTNRWTKSLMEKIHYKEKMSTITNETESVAVYGIAKRDIPTLYKCSDRNILNKEITSGLKKGTIVKLVDSGRDVKIVEEQPFVEIRLANIDGTFLRGNTYWVEAEYIQIASPGK